MKALVFRETAGGQVVLWLGEEPVESARIHLEKTDGNLLKMFDAGEITATVEATFTPPESLYVPPVVIAARDDERLERELMRGMLKVLFNHENRLRVLEARPAVTLDQFKTAIRNILGI
jgi:hypothetical protein